MAVTRVYHILEFQLVVITSTNMSDTFTIDQELAIYIPRIDTRCIPDLKDVLWYERGNRQGDYRVAQNRVKDFISLKFEIHNIGKIKDIQLYDKRDRRGYIFFAASCVFQEWFNNETVANLQKNIKDGDVQAKFKFSDKWFWVVHENVKKSTDSGKYQKPGYGTMSLREHEQIVAVFKDEIQFLRQQLQARDEHIKTLTSVMKTEADEEDVTAGTN